MKIYIETDDCYINLITKSRMSTIKTLVYYIFNSVVLLFLSYFFVKIIFARGKFINSKEDIIFNKFLKRTFKLSI